MKLNGVKIQIEPKRILENLFYLFQDLHYRPKESLVEIYIESLELTIQMIQDQKGGKYTRFRNSTEKKIKKFREMSKNKDRIWVLERIYNEILQLEGYGTLPGFGYASSFGDQIPGNSERQSISTEIDRFPKVQKAQKKNKTNQINQTITIRKIRRTKMAKKTTKKTETTEKAETVKLKRSQLVDAAKELNEELGLEPAIETKPGKKNAYLEEMLKEAGSVVEPDDEFSDGTWEVLKALGIDPRAEEGTEPEKAEEKTEDAEDAEEETEMQETEDNDETQAEEEEVKSDPKPKKEKKEKKAEKPKKEKKESGGLSNKSKVYQSWKKGETDTGKLYEAVNKAVKETTIKSWINQWKKGKNLPAIAKK